MRAALDIARREGGAFACVATAADYALEAAIRTELLGALVALDAGLKPQALWHWEGMAAEIQRRRPEVVAALEADRGLAVRAGTGGSGAQRRT